MIDQKKLFSVFFTACSFFTTCSTTTLFLASVTSVLPVRAEMTQITVTVSSSPNQDFLTLKQQAEDAASQTIQKIFVENPGISEVSIQVIGEHVGQEAPLLASRVSRTDWQTNPSLQAWTKYFENAEILLGFLKLQSAPASQVPQIPATVTGLSREQIENSPGFRDD